MAYLIGTDEAGYGPNLGPLVVGATLWRTPDELVDADLYELLAPAVCVAPETAKQAPARLAIADSKALYKPGSGWRNLELGVGAALHLMNRPVHTWREIWPALASRSPHASPWHQGFDSSLPRDAATEEVLAVATTLDATMQSAGVELLDVRAAVVFPDEFNALVDQHGNKATVLSRVTLQLAADLIANREEAPILLHCDKHGGRNKYAPLLQQAFPRYLIETHCESRELSRYLWGPRGGRCEARFVAKGEGFLPAALASMAAKYLRELAMLAFNDYWSQQVDDLRPTAGYPQDAVRFRKDVQDAKTRLDIPDDQFWRKR